MKTKFTQYRFAAPSYPLSFDAEAKYHGCGRAVALIEMNTVMDFRYLSEADDPIPADADTECLDGWIHGMLSCREFVPD